MACLLSLFLHCKKEKLTDDTYFGKKVIFLGHHGMGSYYKMPVNTYESIEPAIGIGADGCEVDVHLTKDSALILFHDNLALHTTCSGYISDLTLAELKQCKYVAPKDNIYIISADDLFDRLPNIHDFYFSFDVRLDDEVTNPDYHAQFIRAIKRCCNKYNMSDNIFLESTQPFLIQAQQMGLTNKLFLGGALSQAHIDTAYKYSFFGIAAQLDDFEVSADIAHQKGLYVMGYTPYHYYQNLDAIKKKVDILQTDDLISILKRFNRYNYDYIIP